MFLSNTSEGAVHNFEEHFLPPATAFINVIKKIGKFSDPPPPLPVKTNYCFI